MSTVAPTTLFRMTWGPDPSGSLGLAVQGAITETFDPEKELRNAQEVLDADFENNAPEVVIDVDGVKRMNSVGVKKWLDFITRLQAKHPIRFAILSPPFIETARMIPAVLGRRPARVTAFRVPYACSQCSHLFSVLGELKALGTERKWTEFKRPCEKCGKQAELDAIAQEYFWFLGVCES